VLIPGVEASILSKHVLLINMPYEEGGYQSFEDVLDAKSDNSLVIAPHPYFPELTCLDGQLEANPDVFDAIEFCHFYSKLLDFNRPALQFAQKHGLPVVASSDAHIPEQFGLAYSLVQAEKTRDAIVEAIKLGRVKPVARPLSIGHLMRIYLRVSRVKRETWQRPAELLWTGRAVMKWVLEKRL
jgi:predicted metal-dependent phosphoesterase TrpH